MEPLVSSMTKLLCHFLLHAILKFCMALLPKGFRGLIHLIHLFCATIIKYLSALITNQLYSTAVYKCLNSLLYLNNPADFSKTYAVLVTTRRERTFFKQKKEKVKY